MTINDPFDLENYKPQVSLKDIAHAGKCSRQQSASVNARRAKGQELRPITLPRSYDTPPKELVVAMPMLPKHDRNAAKRARRAAKKGEGK